MFALVYVFPVGMALFLSFTKWNIVGKPVFIGLENYINMWQDFIFLKSLQVTLIFTFIRVPLTVFFSLILAVLVNMKIKGRSVFRTIYFVPPVSAVAISAVIWKLLVFHPQLGILNHILEFMHFPPQDWLGNPNLALFSIIIFGIWWDVGFYMVIFLGGLQSIPPVFYEAAKIDGAGSWKVFWKITLPLLVPVMSVVFIMCTVWALQLFSEPYLFTYGGPFYSTQTLVLTVYKTCFKYNKVGYGSAISMFLLLAILLFSFFELKYFRKKAFEY